MEANLKREAEIEPEEWPTSAKRRKKKPASTTTKKDGADGPGFFGSLWGRLGSKTTTTPAP